jgi:hypothetical protein
MFWFPYDEISPTPWGKKQCSEFSCHGGHVGGQVSTFNGVNKGSFPLIAKPTRKLAASACI